MLDDQDTARLTLSGWQKTRGLTCLAVFVLFVLWDYKIALTVLNFTVCLFYAAVVGMRLAAAARAYRRARRPFRARQRRSSRLHHSRSAVPGSLRRARPARRIGQT